MTDTSPAPSSPSPPIVGVGNETEPNADGVTSSLANASLEPPGARGRGPSISAPVPSPVTEEDPIKAAALHHRKQMGSWLNHSVSHYSLVVIVFIRGSWDPFDKDYLHSIQLEGVPELSSINGTIGVVTPESLHSAIFLQEWLLKNYGVTQEQLPVWSDPEMLFAKKYGIPIVPMTRHTPKPDDDKKETTPATPIINLEQVKWQLGPLVESQLTNVLNSSPNEYPNGITSAALAFIAEKPNHLLQRWVAEPTFSNLHGATDRPKIKNAIAHVWDKYRKVEADKVTEWTTESPIEGFKVRDPTSYSALMHLFEKSYPDYVTELANKELQLKQVAEEKLQKERKEKEEEERQIAVTKHAEEVAATHAAEEAAARAKEAELLGAVEPPKAETEEQKKEDLIPE